MKKSLFFLLIFLGCVFVSSGLFVNEFNTPKNYIFLFGILLYIIAIALWFDKLSFNDRLVFWGITIISFFNAGYGLMQFVGLFKTSHSDFFITGQFDNPAGYAASLCLVLPIILFQINYKKKTRFLSIIILSIIVLSIFLSGSRTAIIAVVGAVIVFY